MSSLFIYKFNELNEFTKDIVENCLYGKQGCVMVDIQVEGYSNVQPIPIKIEHFNELVIQVESGEYDGMTLRYWLQILSSYTFPEEKIVVVDGRFYVDGGFKSRDEAIFLGYGGRKFRYKKLDCDEVVLTNNMWNGSDIHNLVLKYIPDNAEWVS